MQTFLPYPNFEKSASCLDYRRLGKQRVEAYQILRILIGINSKKGWRNHPAVLMWKGYEPALSHYGFVMCNEWSFRKYKDNLGLWFMARSLEFHLDDKPIIMPPWFGLEEFHKSHQSNLMRKFPEHYQKYFPNIPNNLPYYWPSKI